MRISDWSSDVCSSDLCSAPGLEVAHFLALAEALRGARQTADRLHLVAHEDDGDAEQQDRAADGPEGEDVGGRREQRSEERRVGKEGVRPCRSRWSPYH